MAKVEHVIASNGNLPAHRATPIIYLRADRKTLAILLLSPPPFWEASGIAITDSMNQGITGPRSRRTSKLLLGTYRRPPPQRSLLPWKTEKKRQRLIRFRVCRRLRRGFN